MTETLARRDSTPSSPMATTPVAVGDAIAVAVASVVRGVPTVRINLVRWIAQLLHQLSIERGTLPDEDLRKFVKLTDDMWEAVLETRAELSPDEQELMLELLKQQTRADAAAAAARPSLPPGSPRTQLGPYLKNLLEADLVQKRAIVAGICEAATARRHLRLRLNQLDGPPTPRPATRHLWPLSFDGAELGTTSVVLILLDGLALGWADRLMGDLERVLDHTMVTIEPDRVRCCVSDHPTINRELLHTCLPAESDSLSRQERPLLFLWDRRTGMPNITLVDHGMQAWPTLDPVTVVNARDDQLVNALSATFSRAVRHAVLLLGQRSPPDPARMRMSPLFNSRPPSRTASPVRPLSHAATATAGDLDGMRGSPGPANDAGTTSPRPIRAGGSGIAPQLSPRASAAAASVSPRASAPTSPRLKGDASPPPLTAVRSSSPTLPPIAENPDEDAVAAPLSPLTAALSLATNSSIASGPADVVGGAAGGGSTWTPPRRAPGTRRLSLHRPSSLSSVTVANPDNDHEPGTS